ncbi:hypothetical protein R3W88_016435 [Solanum pinnatisectum]|uniref:Protein phosphatase n=1 Tax=Solanum pinnatisectum TaxID=50273 RepID=A0AAV9KYI7_9SOLN|nr:hypothetical protein R3W88_016435 [Solanum pinnatisectum]
MKVFNKAFLNAKAKGSSTACILTLSNDTLYTVNVGDIGFFSNSSVLEKVNVLVMASDIIVLGTDGLFDNVHDFRLEANVDCAICISVRKSHRSMNFRGEKRMYN